jgi:hypothetical protein
MTKTGKDVAQAMFNQAKVSATTSRREIDEFLLPRNITMIPCSDCDGFDRYDCFYIHAGRLIRAVFD